MFYFSRVIHHITRYFSIYFIVFFSNSVYAQYNTIKRSYFIKKTDSLLAVFQQSKTDSIKEKALEEYFDMQYMYPLFTTIPEALKKTESLKNLKTYPDINYKVKILENLYLGKLHRVNNIYDEALNYFNKAMRIAKKENDLRYINTILIAKGIIYINLGDLDKALELNIEALNISSDDISIQSKLANLNNIGVILKRSERYDEAEQYFKRVIAYKNSSERIDKDAMQNILSAYNNLGLLYLNHKKTGLGNIKATDSLYNASLNLVEKYGNDKAKTIRYVNMGEVYTLIGKYKLAEDFLKKALLLNSKNLSTKSAIYNSLYELEQNKNNEKKALEYLNLAYETIRNSDYKYKKLSVLEKLYTHYEKNNGHKKALKYYKQYQLLNDTILNEKTQKNLDNLIVKHRVNQTEKEKELLIVKSEKQRERIQLFSIIALCLTILSGVLIYLYQREKQQHVQLFQQTQRLLQSEKQWEEKLKRHVQESTIEVKETTIVSTETKEHILFKLDQQIEKLFFLSKEATLTNLAKKIKTNPKYLSQTINHDFNMSYSNFLNELRIKHALSKFNETDSSFRKYSIKGISEELGYKSSKTFVNAFKKYTGMNVSAYLAVLEES